MSDPEVPPGNEAFAKNLFYAWSAFRLGVSIQTVSKRYPVRPGERIGQCWIDLATEIDHRMANLVERRMVEIEKRNEEFQKLKVDSPTQ